MTLSAMIEKGLLCPNSPSRVRSGRMPVPRFEIPVPKAVDFEERQLPVDPYVLGVLLGDGSMTQSVVAFSCPDNDISIMRRVAKRIPDGYMLTRRESPCPQYIIAQIKEGGKQGFRKKIDSLCLCVHSGDKFIPEIYKLASTAQRLDLLRGLMDTDGSCFGNKTVFHTTSPRLAADIVDLTRSLGGSTRVSYYEREDKDRGEFQVRIKIANCPFYLDRKASQWRAVEPSRYIVSADIAGETECQCIKVSGEDELYITDDYIVTHNTTIGCSAPNPVLFDYDGGAQRINGAHQVPTVQITSWADTTAALDEIAREMPECRSIVIDTAGKMLDYMSAHIIAQDSKMGQRDGSLSLKGYGVRKTMFVNFLKQLQTMGKNVVFIAHEREEKRGDDIVKRPEIGGSSANDLIKELDLVGYMSAIGRDRTIAFDPTEYYYAKNTCSLPAVDRLPVLVDEHGNARGENSYLCGVIEAYGRRQEETQRMTAEYEQLVATVTAAINDSGTLEEINELVAKIPAMQHIYNSKILLASRLNARANALGFKLDKLTKTYVGA